MRILSILLFLVLFITPGSAQKVLQMEKYGRVKTKKIYIGSGITYRLKGDDSWYSAVIEDFDLEHNWIVLKDRYLPLDSIDALRKDRQGARRLGTQLFWFGAGWSTFALLGTATDGEPSTRYRWSDAIVTGTAWLAGLVVPRFFKYRIYKMGKKRRLRLLDLTFQKGAPIKA